LTTPVLEFLLERFFRHVKPFNLDVLRQHEEVSMKDIVTVRTGIPAVVESSMPTIFTRPGFTGMEDGTFQDMS
jgi:hypothetical protein